MSGPGDRPPATGSHVHLRMLSKRFGDVLAVSDVDISVEPGEFVAFLGPSGSGKTTTLMMLAGFETPDAGQVLIDGRDVVRVPPHKRGVGMVFQNYALFPHMTVYQNVAYPLKLRRASSSDIKKRVASALDLVQLPVAAYGDRRPSQLSGGQQQRVALARALVYEPQVLLMDEPMGALDKNLRGQLQDELRLLQRRLGITVLYVTHDQEEAMTLAHRIAVFSAGRVEQIGRPDELYRAPANSFVAHFLGSANTFELQRRDSRWALETGFALEIDSPIPTGASPDRATLLVRPENVVCRAPGTGFVDGVIRDVTYLGSTTRLSVATPVGAVTARLNDGSAAPWGSGDSVALWWEPCNQIVLGADDGNRAPSAGAE